MLRAWPPQTRPVADAGASPGEATVEKRAREMARKQLQSVTHTMRLEQQGVSKEALEKQIDLFAREISPRVLWNE